MIFGLLIIAALFYDHRNNLPLAFIHLYGIIGFIAAGVILIKIFSYYTIIAAPILIWGYFFIMIINSNARNKDK